MLSRRPAAALYALGAVVKAEACGASVWLDMWRGVEGGCLPAGPAFLWCCPTETRCVTSLPCSACCQPSLPAYSLAQDAGGAAAGGGG